MADVGYGSMELDSWPAVTVRYYPTFEDFDEAEQGMARLFGSPPVRRSGGQTVAVKAVGFLGRFFTSVVTISRDGVLIQGSKRGLLPWSEIGDSYETPNLVVLVVARTTAPITLPKRAVIPGELDTIRKYVATRVTADEPGHVATNWELRTN
jgi:hypothetical protein